MILWLLIALLTGTVAALIARPLLKPPERALRRADYDSRVYADQLREVSREVARGVLSAEDAEAARREISRRLIELDGERTRALPERTKASSRQTSLALAVFTPILAVLLYLQIGNPALPDQPIASRALDDEGKQAAQLAEIDNPSPKRGPEHET